MDEENTWSEASAMTPGTHRAVLKSRLCISSGAAKAWMMRLSENESMPSTPCVGSENAPMGAGGIVEVSAEAPCDPAPLRPASRSRPAAFAREPREPPLLPAPPLPPPLLTAGAGATSWPGSGWPLPAAGAAAPASAVVSTAAVWIAPPPGLLSSTSSAASEASASAPSRSEADFTSSSPSAPVPPVPAVMTSPGALEVALEVVL
mmetsp:Transcript_110225/g.235374  ORF Transcript_110225/g.235374 Transcript_110225/m.235374 type:complete len:205 (+) Transcript_110225:1156-1770(+)